MSNLPSWRRCPCLRPQSLQEFPWWLLTGGHLLHSLLNLVQQINLLPKLVQSYSPLHLHEIVYPLRSQGIHQNWGGCPASPKVPQLQHFRPLHQHPNYHHDHTPRTILKNQTLIQYFQQLLLTLSDAQSWFPAFSMIQLLNLLGGLSALLHPV
jgi:hypothetical protein